MSNWKYIQIFFIAFFFLFSSNTSIFAQTPTLTPTPAAGNSELQKKVIELEKKVAELKAQSDTLSSQISLMDNQIALTESRIKSTEGELEELTKNIGVATNRMEKLEGSLTDVSKVLINRIVETYKAGYASPIQILLTSENAKTFFTRLNYLRLVQKHDQQLLYETQQARNDYANQKTIFEDEKKRVEELKTQLQEYTVQIDKEKGNKEKLLEETRGDEKTYQKLLADARARVAGLKAFSSSQGGASILPPQPSPDGWFYNQRDSRWGNNFIGLSDMQIWEVGCLVTATAMLRKQKGENITPADVARESGYFWLSTADMRIPWNGGKFTSVWSKDLGTIDSKLSSGPIIVGLKAGPFGTHFIVLKSGSGGNYIMNDPWNGPDLNFTDYYSTGQIFQYGYLN